MTSARASDSQRPVAGGEWPGKRFGLPESGTRSMARYGRRLAAFAIDVSLAAIISWLFFDYGRYTSLIIFIVLQIIFLALLSGSIGHLLLGIRLVPLKGGVIGVWRPAVRTVLLSIVIPAVVTDRDKRGMHDRIAGTILVRK